MIRIEIIQLIEFLQIRSLPLSNLPIIQCIGNPLELQFFRFQESYGIFAQSSNRGKNKSVLKIVLASLRLRDKWEHCF